MGDHGAGSLLGTDGLRNHLAACNDNEKLKRGRAGEVVLALDATGSIVIFPTIIDPLGFQGALDWAAIGR